MSLMRFAVDAHAIGQHLTGNETYVRSLLRGFSEVDNESEFYAYVSEPAAGGLVPERFQVREVSANPCRRLGWDLSRRLRADRPDLLHVQYTGPLLSPVPVISTVHDVSYLEHPEYFPKLRCLQLAYTVANTVRRAAKILTVSEFSKEAILRAYDIPADKVRVVPNAADPEFRPVNRERARVMVRERFGIEGPFVLTVGDLQPRKNQIGLIAAFSRLIMAHPQLKHDLVLTGQETWFAPRIREAARNSGFANRIHFTGFVGEPDLLQMYNACDCFVFPSFYEGFGFPILEAMACGRAVACSNTSSMPEVADGAGFIFNPTDIDEIKRSMADILLDAELRGRMERLGLKRAAQFSWQKSARATLDIYKEVVEERKGEGQRSAASVMAVSRPRQ